MSSGYMINNAKKISSTVIMLTRMGSEKEFFALQLGAL